MCINKLYKQMTKSNIFMSVLNIQEVMATFKQPGI